MPFGKTREIEPNRLKSDWANARYRYAKAVALHERCDGVIEAASMYENVDLVFRLREQALGLEPPILHLSFDGTLDGS